MQEEIPFQMSSEAALSLSSDQDNWRRRGAPRMEAATARDLVRRLSIFRVDPVRRAPAMGSGDPTIMEGEESRTGDGGSDDGLDEGPSASGGSLSGTVQLASSSRRRGSMIFLGGEDDEDEDDDVDANLTRNLSSTMPAPGVAGEEAVFVERFDNEGLKEYGRAANEHIFDAWLDLGEQTTLGDRLQSFSKKDKDFAGDDGFDVAECYERTIDRQVVGCGFGEEAIKTIVAGEYDPASVLPSLVNGFWATLDDQTFLDACEIAVDRDEDEAEEGGQHDGSVSKGCPRDGVTTPPTAVPSSAPHRSSITSLAHSHTSEAALNATATSSAYGMQSRQREAATRHAVRTRSVVALEEFFRKFEKADGRVTGTSSIDTSAVQAEPLSHHTTASIGALVPPLPPPPSVAADDAWDLSILSQASQPEATLKPLLLPSTATGVVRKPIVQYQPEVERIISTTLSAMSSAFHPSTFHEFLAASTQALDVLNEGDPCCEVTLFASPASRPPLSDTAEGSESDADTSPAVPLVGAEAVMQFVKAHMFEPAQEFGSTVYASEWVFRYTIAFLNARVAVDAADALAREEMVAQCIQLLADIDKFTTTILSLGTKARHYEEFTQLREWMEAEANALIEPIEKRFRFILTRCPFPEQRAVLKKYYKRLEALTATAVKFLSAFDGQWSSTIPYHAAWKEDFLNRSYMRLHGNIATAWMTASLGFVDPVLTMIIKVDSMYAKQPQAFRKRISTASRVEQLISLEGATFNQVAVTIKGVASSVVGLQLCMGARYVLDETGASSDAKWGFSMCDGMPTFETASTGGGGSVKQRAPQAPSANSEGAAASPSVKDDSTDSFVNAPQRESTSSTPQSPQFLVNDAVTSSKKASPVSSFAAIGAAVASGNVAMEKTTVIK